MTFPLVIIPAAGKGTRMGDLTAAGTPKCLLEVGGRALIEHVVEWWWPLADRVVMVVGPGTKHRYFGALSSSFVHLVEQPEPRGVCDAILRGLDAAGGAPRTWLVGLGDCLFAGTAEWPAVVARPSCLVQAEDRDDFCRSYAVDPDGGAVIEKPRLGLGGYVLTWEMLPHLEWGAVLELGITHALLRHCEPGGSVLPIPFHGKYLNVTYPEDLQRWA